MDFLSMLQGGFNPQQTRQVQQIQPTRNPQKTLNVMKSDTVNPQAGRQLQMAPSQGMRRPMAQPMGRAISQGPMKPKMPLQGDGTGYQPQPTYQYVPPQTRSYSPADRDFPGRTNYGVPEDNMIDSPSGYITREQYNQIMNESRTPWQQLPRHQRTAGLPANFPDANNQPVFDLERENEILRMGGLARGRAQAQDPLAVLRSLLGL